MREVRDEGTKHDERRCRSENPVANVSVEVRSKTGYGSPKVVIPLSRVVSGQWTCPGTTYPCTVYGQEWPDSEEGGTCKRREP